MARLDRALGVLRARPLERDEWGPVTEHTMPGFRRLLTSAGMVNMVDALPGVGDYDQVIENADLRPSAARRSPAETLVAVPQSARRSCRSVGIQKDLPALP